MGCLVDLKEANLYIKMAQMTYLVIEWNYELITNFLINLDGNWLNSPSIQQARDDLNRSYELGDCMQLLGGVEDLTASCERCDGKTIHTK